MRLWSDEERLTLRKMWAAGSSRLEISKTLDRTVQAVDAAITNSTLRRDFPRNSAQKLRKARGQMFAKSQQRQEGKQ